MYVIVHLRCIASMDAKSGTSVLQGVMQPREMTHSVSETVHWKVREMNASRGRCSLRLCTLTNGCTEVTVHRRIMLRVLVNPIRVPATFSKTSASFFPARSWRDMA